jgi:hypothetical protein
MKAFFFSGDESPLFGTVRLRGAIAAVLAAWVVACVTVTTCAIGAALTENWPIFALEVALACWCYWRAIVSVLSLIDTVVMER